MIIKLNDGFDHRRERPEGIFRLKVLKSGILVEEYEDHNLVVNGAFFQMARLVGGDVTGRSVTKIGFGTNNAAPAVTQTALTNQYLRAVKGYVYPDNDRVQINWELPVGEYNGKSIAEFGLFTTDETLFARKNRTVGIPKESDISLEGSWIIIF